jgi:para-aminobenzoate synthetase component 1
MKAIKKPKLKLHMEEVLFNIEMVKIFEAFKDLPYSFYLDSSLPSKKLGRFSFIGGDPFLVFKSKGEKIEIIKNEKKTVLNGNPFKELQKLLAHFKGDLYPGKIADEKIPPFLGGGVGYFAYDMHPLVEDFTPKAPDDMNLPDCYFMFVNVVIICDHLNGKIYLASLDFGEEFKSSPKKIKETIRSLNQKQGSPGIHPPKAFKKTPKEPTPFIKKSKYLEKILKAKDYISKGDIYEVCLTQRFKTDFLGDPYRLYRHLREVNPSPFAAYLNFPEVKILSSSPERFLKLDTEGWAESRPIKGTRPRGKNELQDKRLYQDLLNSLKDQAENMMIVDLVRNDLGKVCQNYSIKVSDLMKIEKYATVFQMVSTIRGKLEKELNATDLIQACFPGGSMTGAPKIRAMQIIEELEPIQRGIYSGGLGYLDFRGNIDLSMVIRTILLKGKKAYFQTGGAIVADSDPEEEWQESLDKAKALITALGGTLPNPKKT